MSVVEKWFYDLVIFKRYIIFYSVTNEYRNDGVNENGVLISFILNLYICVIFNLNVRFHYLCIKFSLNTK